MQRKDGDSAILASQRSPGLSQACRLNLAKLIVFLLFCYQMTIACAHNSAASHSCCSRNIAHLKTRQDRDILPSNVRPTHYDLAISPNMDNFTFEGRVVINLDVKEATNVIALNSNELAIVDVSVSMNNEQVAVESFEVHHKEEVLDIKLGKKLEANCKAVLTINYIGFINDKMAGFYRSSYTDEVSGERRFMAATQFEATDARKAFPCWDEPAVKSTFKITLNIRKGLVGISNMDEESRQDSDDGKLTTIRFKESPIMSTYLVAWVVGDLDYIEDTNEDGVLVRVYATRGLAHQGKFALNVAAKTLAFFSRYFDLPYPLPKMDMVAVHDFGAGAMENWGLVTYRTAYLLFDEKDSSLKTKQNVAYVVGHELAHQWFGNLVTMEWWSDLWLNEGFATWVGWLAADYLFPEWDIWTEFIVDDCQAGLSLDGMRSSHPIEVPVKNPSEITQIFDSISYSKGASIIRMLVKYLTEDVFQTGMRSYLRKHKFGNARTDDLWASLAEASGQPVSNIMTGWTRIIGYPVVSVDASPVSEGKITLTLTQNRFLNSGKVLPEEDTTVWSIPLRFKSSKDLAEGVVPALFAERSITFEIPAEMEYFKFNMEQAGFYRVQYPSEWLDRLGQAVEQGLFSASDRIGLVSDLFSLSTAGKLSMTEVLNALRFFSKEDDYNVWASITAQLGDVLSVWWEQDETIVNKLKSFIRDLYRRQVEELGFDFKAGEGDKKSLLRPLVIGMAGRCGEQAVLDEARVRFDRFLAGDQASIHPNLRPVIYNLIIRSGSRTEFDQVLGLYQKFTVPDQKLAALGALGASHDAEVIAAALELSKRDDVVRPQDVMYIFRTVGVNVRGRRLCWEFVKANWQFFYERYYRGSISLLSRVVSFSTQEFTQEADASDVEHFFSSKDLTSIDRTVKQSLENIRSNASWLEQNKENVAQWLAKY